MSTGNDDLVPLIATEIMRWQDAAQAFDEAVGERLALNAAERRCVSFLHSGPQPAGAIANATGLTPAAITSLLDRLESRGLVRRTRSVTDRRKVLVEVSPAARELIAPYYEPIALEGADMLARHTPAELACIHRFLVEARELQERHLARARETSGGN